MRQWNHERLRTEEAVPSSDLPTAGTLQTMGLQDLQAEALANRESVRVLKVLKDGGICHYVLEHW